MTPSPAFDRVGNRLIEHLETMRGHVRQELTREYLLEQLEANDVNGGPAIDVGCGDGRDARWLCSLGDFAVTLVDPSPKMLRFASASNPWRQRALGTIHDVAKRRTWHGKYNVVMSHVVLPYDKQPQAHIDGLVSLCKPGQGIISLSTKGFAGTLDRMRRRGSDPDDIARFKETRTSRSALDKRVNVRAYDMAELTAMLEKAGAQVLSFAGVRIDSDDDYRPWRTVSFPERASILREEFMRGKQERLRHRGQLLHVVARRNPAQAS